MSEERQRTTSVRISDDSIRRATGRTWAEWFAALDAAGAEALTHREIVALIESRKAVGRWWREMVAFAYERSRSLPGEASKIVDPP